MFFLLLLFILCFVYLFVSCTLYTMNTRTYIKRITEACHVLCVCWHKILPLNCSDCMLSHVLISIFCPCVLKSSSVSAYDSVGDWEWDCFFVRFPICLHSIWNQLSHPHETVSPHKIFVLKAVYPYFQTAHFIVIHNPNVTPNGATEQKIPSKLKNHFIHWLFVYVSILHSIKCARSNACPSMV